MAFKEKKINYFLESFVDNIQVRSSQISKTVAHLEGLTQVRSIFHVNMHRWLSKGGSTFAAIQPDHVRNQRRFT